MDDITIKEAEAIRHIRNWLTHRGTTPSIRQLMGVMGYKSPRSVQDIIDRLIQKCIIRRKQNGEFQLLKEPENNPSNPQTTDIPIIGYIAAGSPILADENVEGYIPVATTLTIPPGKYFLLRVLGDSMDEVGINDHDFVLVRSQNHAQLGQNIVALIDNEATVKEYHPQQNVVILKPRSTNPQNKPIILDQDFQIQGVVVASIPDFNLYI